MLRYTRKGFTLIELLVVISIMSELTGERVDVKVIGVDVIGQAMTRAGGKG